MRYLTDDLQVNKQCECGMMTYRKLEIYGHKIPICGKCVCELFSLSKRQLDGSEDTK